MKEEREMSELEEFRRRANQREERAHPSDVQPTELWSEAEADLDRVIEIAEQLMLGSESAGTRSSRPGLPVDFGSVDDAGVDYPPGHGLRAIANLVMPYLRDDIPVPVARALIEKLGQLRLVPESTTGPSQGHEPRIVNSLGGTHCGVCGADLNEGGCVEVKAADEPPPAEEVGVLTCEDRKLNFNVPLPPRTACPKCGGTMTVWSGPDDKPYKDFPTGDDTSPEPKRGMVINTAMGLPGERGVPDEPRPGLLDDCTQCGERPDEFIGGAWFCKACIQVNEEQLEGQTLEEMVIVLAAYDTEPPGGAE